ncbi:MAG: hypothetical protein ACRELY_07530 [Polyangiaceae bacterium]
MKISHAFGALFCTICLFFSASAHATPIDLSALDTMRTESHGPFSTLKWPGVSLKVTPGYNGVPYAEIKTPSLARVDGSVSFALDKPQVSSLTRIFQNAEGATILEHVDVTIDSEHPALQVTSHASARLVEVLRVKDPSERSKSIPVYAYRPDAKHVMFVVAATGQSIEKNTEEESCTASPNHACAFGSTNWQDAMVDVLIGVDRTVAQARGDVSFQSAPKGESNPSRTFIVNASYTQTARDPEPVVSISTRTMDTVFRGDFEGGD